MRVSVVGLGKIGGALAAVLANSRHDVVGVDLRPEPVDLLNQGMPPIDEPGLATLIERNRARLSATMDGASAAAGTEVTFIIVPTPTTEEGIFSSRFVLQAIEECGRGLHGRSAYHLVVVSSTLTPGSMDTQIRPALERASGRSVGESLGLCYNPEFIALGTVVRDLAQPDFVLIGESDEHAGDVLTSIYQGIVGHTTPIRRMTFANAELTKLAVNAFVTMKISFANMLSELCERIPGGDVEVVTSAAGFDTRIGHRYFRGALGYGGPCFPRDNVALAALAARCGARADISVATDRINRHQIDRLACLVQSHVAPGRSRIGILGLSYKPDTSVAEESQGLLLANRLAAAGATVVAYDPQALPAAIPQLASSIAVADSMAACIAGSEILVIATPWPQFREVPSCLAHRTDRITVIDCWRMLERQHAEEVAHLVYPGRASDRQPSSPAALTPGRTA